VEDNWQEKGPQADAKGPLALRGVWTRGLYGASNRFGDGNSVVCFAVLKDVLSVAWTKGTSGECCAGRDPLCAALGYLCSRCDPARAPCRPGGSRTGRRCTRRPCQSPCGRGPERRARPRRWPTRPSAPHQHSAQHGGGPGLRCRSGHDGGGFNERSGQQLAASASTRTRAALRVFMLSETEPAVGGAGQAGRGGGAVGAYGRESGAWGGASGARDGNALRCAGGSRRAGFLYSSTALPVVWLWCLRPAHRYQGVSWVQGLRANPKAWIPLASLPCRPSSLGLVWAALRLLPLLEGLCGG
jgi:hypothetical protein